MSIDEPANPSPTLPNGSVTDAAAETPGTAAAIGTQGAPSPSPSPSTDAAGAARAPGNRGLKLAVVALAALSFALAVVAAVAANSNKDSGRDAAVRRAAGAFGTAMLTYSPKSTVEWRRNVSRLSTGNFKKDFDRTGKALAAVFEYTGNSVRAVDAEVFLGDVSDKTAVAFVIIDAASTTNGKAPTSVQGYFRLDLLNNDGRWLVYELTSYNDANRAGGAVGASTSTTAAAGR